MPQCWLFPGEPARSANAGWYERAIALLNGVCIGGIQANAAMSTPGRARSGGRGRLSNGPIVNVQTGNAPEVAPVAGDHHGAVLQSDGSDTQIHEANVKPEGLVGSPW